MDASTPGRLWIGTTSTGTLDSVDDNLDAPEHTRRVPRGDLIKIEGLTAGNSYRVRAWFGTSKGGFRHRGTRRSHWPAILSRGRRTLLVVAPQR